MSTWFDKSFIDLHVAPRLDKFSWVRDGVAQFRCPLCGDSQTSENKRRGFFYTRDDTIRFKCHNCDECSGWSLGPWLSEFDATGALHKQYGFEKFKEGRETEKIEFAPKQQITHTASLYDDGSSTVPDGLLCNATRLCDLPQGHLALQYVQGRKMPLSALERLWFVDNFKEFAISMRPYEASTLEKLPEDPRVVIPFLSPNGSDVYCFQGRALLPDVMRYVTVKQIENSPKIFGLEKLDTNRTRLVVEGPFDSLFLPNCVATADSNLLSYANGDLYIPDNQYRNPEICTQIERIIQAGKSVCLFPREFECYKDINEFIKEGEMSVRELFEVIARNTYKGLRAKLVWTKLKGV